MLGLGLGGRGVVGTWRWRRRSGVLAWGCAVVVCAWLVLAAAASVARASDGYIYYSVSQPWSGGEHYVERAKLDAPTTRERILSKPGPSFGLAIDSSDGPCNQDSCSKELFSSAWEPSDSRAILLYRSGGIGPRPSCEDIWAFPPCRLVDDSGGQVSEIEYARHALFWTRGLNNTIARARLSADHTTANEPDLAFLAGKTTPEHDEITGVAAFDTGTTIHLFWINSSGPSIGHAELDGSLAVRDGTLEHDFIKRSEQPLEVATDGRYVYWTEQGVTNRSVHRAEIANPANVEDGAPTALNARALAVDRRYVYIATPSEIRRISALKPSGGSWKDVSWTDVVSVSGDINEIVLYEPPHATTAEPADLETRSVTLQGYVNPRGQPTYAQFALRSANGDFSAFSGSMPIDGASADSCGATDDSVCASVRHEVTRLRPGTTYEYTLTARNRFGRHESSGSFTTPSTEPPPPPAPGATTGDASSVSSTSAVLNGTVTPVAGHSTRYYFEYGTTTQYGSRVPAADAFANPGPGPQAVTEAVSGLQPGTTYHFRLVASNDGGTATGADRTFTTSRQCLHGERLRGTPLSVSGCFAQVVEGGKARHAAAGAVLINGVRFEPPDRTATLTIDECSSAPCAIRTSTGYKVYVGPAKIRDDSKPYSTQFDRSTGQFAIKKLTLDKLYGVPFSDIIVTPTAVGGAKVAFESGIPLFAPDLAAAADIKLNRTGSVESAVLRVGNVMKFGPFIVPGVTLAYNRHEQTWSGDVNLILPVGPSSKVCGKDIGPGGGKKVPAGLLENDKVSANCGFTGGLTIDAEGFYPRGIRGSVSGLSVPLDPWGATYLTGIAFDTNWQPGFSFTGAGTFAVGPSISLVRLLGIDAAIGIDVLRDQKLSDKIPGAPKGGVIIPKVPFTLQLSGTAKLFEFIEWQQVSAAFYGVANPFFAITAKWGPDLSLGRCFGATAQLGLAGSTFRDKVNVMGSGKLGIHWATRFDRKKNQCKGKHELNAGKASAVISNRGLAICGKFVGIPFGVAGPWPSKVSGADDLVDKLELFKTGGCNVGDYVVNYKLPTTASAAALGAAAARRTPARSIQIRIPRGGPFAVLRIRGRGAPPEVAVRGPGLSLSSRGKSRRHLIMVDTRRNVTYVRISRPRGGRYVIAPLSDSSAVAGVSVANGLPDPAVRGRVLKRGKRWILVWRARRLPQQRIDFYEQGAGGVRRIGSSRRNSGRLAFRPAEGRVASRTVVASVSHSGARVPAATVPVATFRGPKPRPPASPPAIALRRHGVAFDAAWSPGKRRAAHYRVEVKLGTERRVYLPVAPQITIAAVPRDTPVEVSVRAVSALGLESAVTRARTGSPSVRLKVRRPRMQSVRRTGLRVDVSCSGLVPCTGTLSVRGGGRILGSKRLSLDGTSSRVVRVRLDRGALRRLATRRVIRLELVARVKDANAQRTKVRRTVNMRR